MNTPTEQKVDGVALEDVETPESEDWGRILGRRECERDLRESIVILIRQGKTAQAETLKAVESAFRVRTDHLEGLYAEMNPPEVASTRKIRPEDLVLRPDVFVATGTPEETSQALDAILSDVNSKPCKP